MNLHFKIQQPLLQSIKQDLGREHPYAYERVGFVSCKIGPSPKSGLVILAHEYHPVEDTDYEQDSSAGAVFGTGAIRKAMQVAYTDAASMFHIHAHPHSGTPRFSKTDLESAYEFVPDFWNVQPNLPHGILVLSNDSMAGLCWVPDSENPAEISKFTIVGVPLNIIWSA